MGARTGRRSSLVPGPVPMNVPTFASHWNAGALEDAYQRWLRDPQSVDASWRLFFEGFELGRSRPEVPAAGPPADAAKQGGVTALIDAYRELGHFQARLDPLSD